MYPTGLPSSETDQASEASTDITDISVYKSRARFAGKIMVVAFLVLIAVTILILWYFESQERGVPDVRNETEQLIEEVKKEVGR